MKNVTVSLDDETFRRARIRAAEVGRSLSSLVRAFLNDLGGDKSEFERLHEMELNLRKRETGFRATELLDRDSLHER